MNKKISDALIVVILLLFFASFAVVGAVAYAFVWTAGKIGKRKYV